MTLDAGADLSPCHAHRPQRIYSHACRTARMKYAKFEIQAYEMCMCEKMSFRIIADDFFLIFPKKKKKKKKKKLDTSL